jgi:hypothetical protein
MYKTKDTKTLNNNFLIKIGIWPKNHENCNSSNCHLLTVEHKFYILICFGLLPGKG